MMMSLLIFLFFDDHLHITCSQQIIKNPKDEITKWFQEMADPNQSKSREIFLENIKDLKTILEALGLDDYRLRVIKTQDVLNAHALRKWAGNGQIPPTHDVSKYKLVLSISLPNQENLSKSPAQSCTRFSFFLNIPDSLGPLIQETLSHRFSNPPF